jgi:heterodisulfide reductase subunit A
MANTSTGNKPNGSIGAVMVVGGGVAGVQAALDLANAGVKVYLVEKSPAIGGAMAQLDKTFPTNDCSMCILAPKLVEAGRHENIEILTYAEVEKVEGEPGRFKATVRKKARRVDLAACNSCGDCLAACPRQTYPKNRIIQIGDVTVRTETLSEDEW